MDESNDDWRYDLDFGDPIAFYGWEKALHGKLGENDHFSTNNEGEG